ncbi:hypothetical protein ElyMa_006782200 [Elysia marginata]|uniref:Receptor ligand binding region domain-containing protein n=1 Tax=Elysia marginata TaxID=1093978 RepID=A0AAV4IZG0_9GAST|nr:hypothetical protein ElyMa_006782200 [Elysia marginata]
MRRYQPQIVVSICVFALDFFTSPTSGASTAPVLPQSCIQSSVAVVCSSTDKETLQQLTTVLLMEVLVDFVLFDTSDKTCSCPMVQLVKSLKETDVVVLTNATCGIEEYTKCGDHLPKATSVFVAGLAISSSDSKMKWAVKHHVIDLWNKAKVLKKSWQRVIVFRAILKDVSLSVVKLGDEAAKNGANHLIFGDIPPEPQIEMAQFLSHYVADIPTRPQGFFGFFCNSTRCDVIATYDLERTEVRPVNLNLKEQLWEMNAEKHEKASKAFSDEVMDTMSELEGFDALVGGQSVNGVQTGLKQQSPGDKVEQVNEAVMQANLDNQLAQIKQDLNRKGRKKRHENKMFWINEAISPSNITWPGISRRFQLRVHKHRRNKRSKTVRANIMPYKIFIGGDFTSLFDSVAIDLATSMEANLPKNKLLMVQEAQAIAEAAPPSNHITDTDSESSILIPHGQESIPPATNPVKAALLAEGGVSDDIDDLTEEDVADELKSLDDDRNVLEEEERTIAQMSKSLADKGIIVPDPGVADSEDVLAALAAPAAAAAAAATGTSHPAAAHHTDSLEEDKRRSKEQDHIFKNFIVFIVAIIGIIIIFAVLIIMPCEANVRGDGIPGHCHLASLSKPKYTVLHLSKARSPLFTAGHKNKATNPPAPSITLESSYTYDPQ